MGFICICGSGVVVFMAGLACFEIACIRDPSYERFIRRGSRASASSVCGWEDSKLLP